MVASPLYRLWPQRPLAMAYDTNYPPPTRPTATPTTLPAIEHAPSLQRVGSPKTPNPLQLRCRAILRGDAESLTVLNRLTFANRSTYPTGAGDFSTC